MFRVEPEGLTLAEVAKGIDVRRDVLDQMAFPPYRIADPLPEMDAALFTDAVTKETGVADVARSTSRARA